MSGAMIGVILAVGATVLEGIAQTFLKLAFLHRHRHLWTAAGIAVFGIESLVYTAALKDLAVSVAYPIGALSFVVVTLLSRFWLKEEVDRTRWLGVLAILAGATLIAARAT